MSKRIFQWLFVEPKFLWISVLLPMAAVVFCTRIVVSEPAIRLTGLALQVFGIFAAVWGIAETWKQFDLGDPLQLIREWFRRCPFRKMKAIAGSMNATSQSDLSSAHGYAWWKPDPLASTEERLQILEKNIPLLNERIDRTQSATDSAVSQLRGDMNQQATATHQRTHQLDMRLKEFGTGSLHISAIGAFWVLVGSILGSASTEIFRVMQ